MPKFGSYRLVFNVTNYENEFYINIDCLDIDFTGFKIKNCERIFSSSLDMTDNSYEEQVFLMVTDIKKVFKNRQITKSFNILNFGSSNMFYESLTIPKLSYLESSKALNLDISKIYDKYSERFVYDFVKSSTNPHTNTFKVGLIDINIYKKVLQWFKDLKINLNYVSISHNGMNRLINKVAGFNKKRTSIIVDMNKFTSEVYTYDSKKVEGVRFVKEGYQDLINSLQEKLNLDEETVLNLLNTENSSGVDLEEDDLNTLMEEAFPNLLIEIKRVIGEFFIKQPIDNIYLTMEEFDTPIVRKAFSKLLKVEFTNFNNIKPNILHHFLAYGASIKPQKANDYIFPTKVK